MALHFLYLFLQSYDEGAADNIERMSWAAMQLCKQQVESQRLIMTHT